MKNHKIMLVDDDPLISEIICATLRKETSFDTCYFEDPTEALQKISEITPDILLLDWEMPDMSGLEFLHHIRKNNDTQNICVFMLTGKKTDHDFEVARQAGADGYFTKPIDILAFNNSILTFLATKDETIKCTAH